MRCNAIGLGLLAVAFALSLGVAPASAGFCRDQAGQLVSCDITREFAAQSRPRITVHPSRNFPGPNAKRYCRSWLVTEYRPSGPVITPQMVCWWQ
jgi:hypothetical protein